MKELLIIRHGEAEHLVGDEPLTGGWTDTKLTERGRMQARLTGERLQKLLCGRDYLFIASDLARAGETAEIIGTYIGRKPVYEAAIREFNNGIAAGMKKAEAKRLEKPMQDGNIADWRPFDQSESWREFYRRVAGFMDRISGVDTAVIVTHSGTAFNMVFWFLGLSEDYFGQVFTEMDPCGLTWLRMSEYGERSIYKLNDTGHLGD